MNKKKIKVFSLATTYPESPLSSRPKFVHVLNKELVKLGVDVKTITPHTKGSLTKEVMDSVLIRRFRYLPENYEISPSISIIEAVAKSKSSFIKVITMTVIFFIFTFFECLKEKPDILHGHWAFPSGFMAYVMSTIFRKKFIVTLHGPEILLSKFKILERIVIFGLNKSVVVANSDYTKNILTKMGVKNENIVRINVPPDFVDNMSDTESLEQFRERFTDRSHKIILFAGRLVELKGCEYLIRTLLELGDLKLHLIIAGDGILRERLHDLTKSIGLESKVTFFGGASREELGLLRNISDIFVCPSIVDSRGDTDGLPMVILEALKAGLPIIASSVGGITDIIKHEVNGLLVNQKDPVSIAKAVRRVISDEKIKKKMIENSIETLKEFSPELIAKQYFYIFQGFVNNQ